MGDAAVDRGAVGCCGPLELVAFCMGVESFEVSVTMGIDVLRE